jgi:pimeloyl-ACP methyl ester carboxylesterase
LPLVGGPQNRLGSVTCISHLSLDDGTGLPHRAVRHLYAPRVSGPVATSPEGARYLAAPTRDVDLDGTVVPVRSFGDGPAILLVHGFPLSGFTWRFLIPRLAARATCIAVDLPGLGASRWTAATDFSFPGQGTTLRRVADALGLDRYRVLAHDTGRTFARFLALGDPRVERLALINTEIPGHRPPWIPTYQRLMALPGSAGALGALTRSRAFVRSPLGFGGCFVDPARLDGEFHTEFVAPIARSATRQDGIRQYLRGARWGPVDDLRVQHARLDRPVRLVWGVDDPTFPVARAREMLHQLPQADLVEIARARLLPHEERPEAVLAAPDDFHTE